MHEKNYLDLDKSIPYFAMHLQIYNLSSNIHVFIPLPSLSLSLSTERGERER